MVDVMHPRFVEMNTQFFPSLATIEVKSVTLDEFGQEVVQWAGVQTFDNVPCAKSPLSAQERQAASYTATDQVWHVLLQGSYPEITTRNRVVIDEETFDIDAVETDQTATLTRLRARKLEV